MKAPRNELGARIRYLRQARQLTQSDLARRIGCPQTYVSKFEIGKIRPTGSFLERLVDALKLSDDEEREVWLLKDLFDAEPESSVADEDAVRRRQRAIRELEATARYIRGLDVFSIPGLLQTASYARRVFGSVCHPCSEKSVAGLVEERLLRQKIVEPGSRRFSFVLTEAALRNNICSKLELQEQFDHLLDVGSYPNVDLGVVPWSTPLPTLPVSTYSIIDETVVIVDTPMRYLTERLHDTIKEFVLEFEVLKKISATGSQLEELLCRILGER